MDNNITTASLVRHSVALGIVGGAALIATVSLTVRGPVIYIPYALLIVASAIYVRSERVRSYGMRFLVVLVPLAVATISLYVFIAVRGGAGVSHLSVIGHAVRLAVLGILGTTLSAAVAVVTATRQSTAS